MKPDSVSQRPVPPPSGNHSEVLILPEGRILAHNITPEMARLLHSIVPDDEAMRLRANIKPTSTKK